MRGKLRDKSSIARRDTFRQGESEQRRPYRRDIYATQWSGQDVDEDDIDGYAEEEYLAEEEVAIEEPLFNGQKKS